MASFLKKGYQKKLAVGRPIEPLVTINVRVVAVTRQDGSRLFGIEIQDFQRRPIFQIADFFTIR